MYAPGMLRDKDHGRRAGQRSQQETAATSTIPDTVSRRHHAQSPLLSGHRAGSHRSAPTRGSPPLSSMGPTPAAGSWVRAAPPAALSQPKPASELRGLLSTSVPSA